MTENPRHRQIMNLLQNRRQVSVAELTERLKVSQVTIRKDLAHLEERGFIFRSHGGARLAEATTATPSVGERKDSHADEKKRIAAKAMELIQHGDAICMDAGSTNIFLAEKIVHLPIKVITNSLVIMQLLADSQDVTLTSLGGNYRKEGGSFIGPITVDAVDQLQFDIAFVGTRAITPGGEFLTQNTIEGKVKNRMLQAAKRKVILADSSKLNANGFSKFAKADLIDVLITDSGFNMVEEFQDLGIEVITV